SAAVDHLFAKLARSMDVPPARERRRAAVETLAADFAEQIRRFVRFAADNPELNRILVHEATASTEAMKAGVAKVAKLLQVPKAKAKEWVERLVDEEVLIKLSGRHLYRARSRQLALFAPPVAVRA
ncbi:MAG TPA: hypothetical protein PK413_12055, partial [Thermoanaerobaculia bacterium]|nr:hypothetical protein [Thermoanaerobaculia bacterium]